MSLPSTVRPIHHAPPSDELRAKALKVLTSLTHGELFSYCDERNHDAVRHIMALAEKLHPADSNPEAKQWYEFEHMVLLAAIYKVAELLPQSSADGLKA